MKTMRRALVIGEALIDIVMSPEGLATEIVGGSPANVAVGLARLGSSVRFATALARDARGERIADHLEQSGVQIDPSSWSLGQTSTATAVIDDKGQAAYTFDVVWQLPEAVDTRDAMLVHAGSLGIFLTPGARMTLEALSRARSTGAIVSIDPNIRSMLLSDHTAALRRFEDAARECHLVKLSDEDAAWLYPGAATDVVIERILSLGVQLVAVTQGSHGSTLATSQVTIQYPAPVVVVMDTVGAGDAFQSALLTWILDRLRPTSDAVQLSRADLLDLAGFASRAAAWVVQRRGAEPATRAQLNLQRPNPSGHRNNTL